jgi:hypothetical protein
METGKITVDRAADGEIAQTDADIIRNHQISTLRENLQDFNFGHS